LAGRQLAGLLAGISVTVTLLSAISLMGGIAFIFQLNLQLLPGVIAIPFTIPIITRVIIPFYRRLPITTGYEYLEYRFNAAVRTTASILFVLMRLFYLAVVIYAPSVALTVTTGWPLYQNVLVMGTVSVILAAAGGMRAVIWSELLKFLALLTSFAAILATLWLRIEGGIAGAWNIAREGDRLEAFDFSLNPTVTFAFWGILIGSFFQQLVSFGADQITIQRYLASSSLVESQKSYRFCAWMSIPINLLITIVGIGIYAFYRQHPGEIQGLSTADHVLPFFAVHELPAGLSGLAIATIFSMALTTHSSGLHSVNTTIMNDLFRQSAVCNKVPAHPVRLARIGVACLGVFTIVVALYISKLGIIIIASKKIIQFFGGVLLGIILLGMCCSRANATGTLAGAFVGISAVALISQLTDVSFFWYAPIGSLLTVTSGYLLSFVLPRNVADAEPGR
jgi:SSS family transporter